MGLVSACGGRALETGANGSAGTSASAGATARAGAPSGGAPSGGSSSGGAPSAGTGAAPGGATSQDACSQPMESGPCNAYIPSFWHDPKTGVCEPFAYGGCGGNENRFPTREDCLKTCPGLGANYDNCLIDFDCRVIAASCCGVCEPVGDQSLLSVAKATLEQFQGQHCSTIEPCAPCLDPGETESTMKYFRPACSAELQCTTKDIRSEPKLTGCQVDADCILRDGAECCPQCDGAGWIGARKGADFCTGTVVGCDDCISKPPANLRVYCDDGVCTVTKTLK